MPTGFKPGVSEDGDDSLQLSKGRIIYGAINTWDRVTGAREPSGRIRQVKGRFASSVCAQMHTVWEANRRRWISVCRCRAKAA